MNKEWGKPITFTSEYGIITNWCAKPLQLVGVANENERRPDVTRVHKLHFTLSRLFYNLLFRQRGQQTVLNIYTEKINKRE